jgi:hypothetical protein
MKENSFEIDEMVVSEEILDELSKSELKNWKLKLFSIQGKLLKLLQNNTGRHLNYLRRFCR